MDITLTTARRKLKLIFKYIILLYIRLFHEKIWHKWFSNNCKIAYQLLLWSKLNNKLNYKETVSPINAMVDI